MNYDFVVTQGHQVASGLADDSPFPKGTIALQKPHFELLGLNLSKFLLGTINAKFECSSVEMIRWDLEFSDINWCRGFPSESFRFIYCDVLHDEQLYKALIYQPVKETKIGHFQQENVLEILAEPIPNLTYGSHASLIIDSDYLLFR